jgi:hypothetical protein
MRKYFVLTILFVLPLVVYLFFASGINHFAKLPILTKDIKDISVISSESFNNKITILGFFWLQNSGQIWRCWEFKSGNF